MSIGIGPSFTPQHGERMGGQIGEEPRQGQVRGSERRFDSRVDHRQLSGQFGSIAMV